MYRIKYEIEVRGRYRQKDKKPLVFMQIISIGCIKKL